VSLLAPLVLTAVLAAGVAACGEEEPAPSAPTGTGSGPAAAPRPAGELGRPVTVSGRANIFGAGLARPPAPGSGGAGVLPPGWRLLDGENRVLTVPHATGRVKPIDDHPAANGPAGDKVGVTDVASYGGISGIAHRHNGMFLVGVFLTDDPPADPAPARLDFTGRERFDSLAPRIAQTFLIGDGRGRAFAVPAQATRLYVGFADGYLYQGPPGWYGNNVGELEVTVDMRRG
jgi:hypothetical protein